MWQTSLLQEQKIGKETLALSQSKNFHHDQGKFAKRIEIRVDNCYCCFVFLKKHVPVQLLMAHHWLIKTMSNGSNDTQASLE